MQGITRLKCTSRRLVVYDRTMLMLAMDEATKTTIAYVVLWFIAFPALVTALIGVALFQTYKEHAENVANRRRNPRP
jgi:hypothetical protein